MHRYLQFSLLTSGPENCVGGPHRLITLHPSVASCNSRVQQENPLSPNRFTLIQGKTISWFSKCRVPLQNFRVCVILTPKSGLKKHCPFVISTFDASIRRQLVECHQKQIFRLCVRRRRDRNTSFRSLQGSQHRSCSTLK